jgi:hypothetical protein
VRERKRRSRGGGGGRGGRGREKEKERSAPSSDARADMEDPFFLTFLHYESSQGNPFLPQLS